MPNESDVTSRQQGAASEPSYSTIEVARELGVTVQTVQRWVDAGYLACWRTVGGHRRISAESVRAFRRSAGFDAREAARGEAAVVLAEAPAAAGLSVLIVDDEPADRDMVAYLVRRVRPEASVAFADNGFAALIEIGRKPPRVLITDVSMPYMNGTVMLRSLFEQPDRADIAVLALSSHSTREIAEMGGLPEGVAFLHKPLSRGALERFLSSVPPEGEPGASA